MRLRLLWQSGRIGLVRLERRPPVTAILVRKDHCRLVGTICQRQLPEQRVLLLGSTRADCCDTQRVLLAIYLAVMSIATRTQWSCQLTRQGSLPYLGRLFNCWEVSLSCLSKGRRRAVYLCSKVRLTQHSSATSNIGANGTGHCCCLTAPLLYSHLKQASRIPNLVLKAMPILRRVSRWICSLGLHDICVPIVVGARASIVPEDKREVTSSELQDILQHAVLCIEAFTNIGVQRCLPLSS
mmetsp:Transcript_16867/g.39198  ORF Transcript_16867/g.39198 Transcript_16867/m.39198 type:complete len:240 (-) Transcript_16867:2425-3144(-)